jgi:hypothetical protein
VSTIVFAPIQAPMLTKLGINTTPRADVTPAPRNRAGDHAHSAALKVVLQVKLVEVFEGTGFAGFSRPRRRKSRGSPSSAIRAPRLHRWPDLGNA